MTLTAYTAVDEATLRLEAASRLLRAPRAVIDERTAIRGARGLVAVADRWLEIAAAA